MGKWVDGIPVSPADAHDDRSEWSIRRVELEEKLIAAAQALLVHAGACEISLPRTGVVVTVKLVNGAALA